MTKNDVRFIVNTGQAQTLFGTPFGNSGRNLAQDAMTSIANVEIFKKIKLSERVAFEVHATMLNAFNHANFSSIDPFLEDAGLSQQGTGFGDPTLTNAPGRKIWSNRVDLLNEIAAGLRCFRTMEETSKIHYTATPCGPAMYLLQLQLVERLTRGVPGRPWSRTTFKFLIEVC